MAIRCLGTTCAVIVISGVLTSAAGDERLIQAAKSGDAAAVRTLLQQRAPVGAVEADGSTALHQAVRYDKIDVADLLIAAGADVKAATRYNITPLSLACTNGNAALIERLLKAGADPNSTSHEGQTALMTAALNGNVESVKLLLMRGAGVNVAEPARGQTALMWAASEGNAAASATLIEAGGDLKAKSKAGFTPLLFAVRGGHLETVKTLLKHGADANDAAPDGTSALGMAVVNAYFELAGVLLDSGANPNAPDPRGSPLHTLAWLRRPGSDGGNGLGRRSYGPPVPTGNLTDLELAKALLARGANPNSTFATPDGRIPREGSVRNPPLITLGRHIMTYTGATPFYLAARNGDAPYMRLLAEHGADPKIPTAGGVTPLMAAAGLDTWEGETPGPYTGVSEAERLEAVKLALELGNDINATSNFGDYEIEGDPEYTLIHPPLNSDRLMGIAVGGDPRWSGSTALHGSIISNQPTIVQFLVDSGAKLDVKNKSGWTPLMMAGGVFLANAKREYPEAAAILKKALAK